ncbi:MAG: efflux RND transporter periplasmic adaptor subunit [Gammaproteobacteria bacterium]|nr:efflux RND transporter periplasmic adaptor subunit [Gammaproteobacteria bacterium]MBU1646444.1 efflux RND transporter periplasmic adaptor subunit [Gammaproteobacteria bacterium]MBU1970987.1 efflux RND transporter periplasmic adaptor subunit [Gammaproteobacteria bacterium]
MKSFTRRNLILAAFAAAFLVAFGWIIATQGPLAPISVTMAKAAEMRLERTLFGIGTLEARRGHAVGPTVAGRLDKVLVDHGDKVQAGQLLAEMEPVDLDARLAAGAAAAAAASQRVHSAAAALAEAESRARLAKNSAERYADLRRRNFFSQEAADAKAHEAAAALAAKQAATAALAAAKEDARRAQSELAGTGKSRAHLRLTSPVDGIVSARLAEPGSTVVAGQAVVQVIEPDALWFKVRIDQGRSSGLAVGLPATIALRSAPGKTPPGRVARVDLVGDAVTEERIAYVALDAPPENLAIGELAEVTLQLPPIDKALAIPAAALTRQGNTMGVWKLVDDRAQFAAVTPGVSSAQGQVQILSGLAAGETVLVYSSKALAPDARVKVVDSLVKQPQK